jgi:hypothetical protein
MDAADVVKTVMRFCQQWGTLRVFSESNGVGMLVPELFKSKDTAIDGRLIIINSHYEQRPKEGKIQGVLELPFALGNFVFTNRIWSNPRMYKQMKDYPAVRHDDWLDALVTLYEKSIPARQSGGAKPWSKYKFGTLNYTQLLEPSTQKTKTMLGKFNEYFA